MKRNLIYHTEIPLGETITIETEEKRTTQTDLEAISRDGITITCDQSTLAKIVDNTASVAPKKPVSLLVSFFLNKSDEKIKASCNVVAVRRLSRDIFQMVMRFHDINDHTFERIDQYIEHSFERTNPADGLEQVA